jgi:hypothetical protein
VHVFILQINSGLLSRSWPSFASRTGSICSGDTARLIQFADRRYLKELERRVALFSQTHRGAKAEWQLHKFIKPPTCLSIRAHDFFNEYRKSLVVGDRLYVNMLVKFESIQVCIFVSKFLFFSPVFWKRFLIIL